MGDNQWQLIDGGELVAYPNPFGNLQGDELRQSVELESMILQMKSEIETNFLKMAMMLDVFDSSRLFLGRGYETFKAWADSPEIDIGYRAAHDLLRIVREIVPLAQENGVLSDARELGITKLRLLLPLLADEGGQALVVETIPEILPMTSKDAAAYIKELRGIATPLEDGQPAIFKAKVTQGESFHTVVVTCSDGVDFYGVGTLKIKPSHWPRWSERFSEHFIEYT